MLRNDQFFDKVVGGPDFVQYTISLPVMMSNRVNVVVNTKAGSCHYSIFGLDS